MAKVTLNQHDLESAVKCQMEKMGLKSSGVSQITFIPKRKVGVNGDSIECIIEYDANPIEQKEETTDYREKVKPFFNEKT